uniref:Uncharacterized protein n=1 Tax=Clastoptera arizonana TaxID=38151 RepID=A0A1B6BZ85_9HEMI
MSVLFQSCQGSSTTLKRKTKELSTKLRTFKYLRHNDSIANDFFITQEENNTILHFGEEAFRFEDLCPDGGCDDLMSEVMYFLVEIIASFFGLSWGAAGQMIH